MAFTNPFKRGRGKSSHPLYFHNTLSAKKDLFIPAPHAKEIRMYCCGPTVYGRQHIGNLSMFVFTDVLRRVLEYNDLPVKQVINFTDFGHLSSDSDEGEDKMAKGLKREGLALSLENMRVLGEKYANLFLEDIRALNIPVERVLFPRASDYVPGQIAMIESLEQKGYTYQGEDGVYFDTSRFPEYGKLGNIDLSGLRVGARVRASADKRNPTDFLLWKSNKKVGWDSPWGLGFPGWHIECSAMIRACLGQQIDIHTGGIEHIPVHHNNEIAQSESATGKKPLSRFWLHRAHLQFEGGKMAKSEGNVVYLPDLVERGFHPLSLRYLLLGAHYRTQSNFTWEALEAAQNAYFRLLSITQKAPKGGAVNEKYRLAILTYLNDDLDTPGALSEVWALTKDPKISPEDMRATIADIDRALGLQLDDADNTAIPQAMKIIGYVVSEDTLPQDILSLFNQREAARANKDWSLSDKLRLDLEEKGYGIEDRPEGAVIRRH